MSFTTAHIFKQTITSVLQAYCKYSMWQPKRFAEAKQLEKDLAACETKALILEKLYNAYCDLLQKNSKDDLVGKLALIIADELDLDREKVSSYLNRRAYKISIGFGNLICNKAIPKHTERSMSTWLYNEETFPEVKDPIVVCYETNKLQSENTPLCHTMVLK